MKPGIEETVKNKNNQRDAITMSKTIIKYGILLLLGMTSAAVWENTGLSVWRWEFFVFSALCFIAGNL